MINSDTIYILYPYSVEVYETTAELCVILVLLLATESNRTENLWLLEIQHCLYGQSVAITVQKHKNQKEYTNEKNQIPSTNN